MGFPASDHGFLYDGFHGAWFPGGTSCFAVLMILNCILGIMAKIAPQMNMFSVGIQLKILLGFLVLFLTIQLLPYVSDFVLTEMKRMVTGIASGMHG